MVTLKMATNLSPHPSINVHKNMEAGKESRRPSPPVIRPHLRDDVLWAMCVIGCVSYQPYSARARLERAWPSHWAAIPTNENLHLIS